MKEIYSMKLNFSSTKKDRFKLNRSLNRIDIFILNFSTSVIMSGVNNGKRHTLDADLNLKG